MSKKSLQEWCSQNNRIDLLEEWDKSNNAFTPFEVSYGTSKKAWWVCKQGHKWETRICHRTLSKSNCPYCAGEKAVIGKNDLKTLAPDLCLEWSYEKNEGLLPEMFLPKSERKVWWKGKCGHEWYTQIALRYNGSGCPYCANNKVLPGFNDLQTLYPELEKEWDYSKNDIKPYEVLAKSSTKAWWIDSFGHSWTARVVDRARGAGCPICAGKHPQKGINDLYTVCPSIAAQWNYYKNGDLTPDMFTKGSGKKVWWICKEGHEWEAKIANRAVKGTGCPICSKNRVKRGVNDFATKHPELMEEWDFEKNPGIDPTTIASTRSEKIWWKCKYQHSWRASIDSRLLGSGCPICNARQRTSFPEQAILFYLSKTYPDILNGYEEIFKEWKGSELDIFIPSESLGIEYDGKQWHSSSKAHTKEIKKYQLCKQRGIRLFRIKEERQDSDYETCDRVFYVQYSSQYEQLNNVISQLGEFLRIPDDVDVVRDRERIKSNYYGILKNASLSEKVPELVKEWNYERNEGLTPEMVMPGCSDKVWWKCSKGHEWKAAIGSRVSGIGCPICSNKKVLKGYNDLATTHQSLLREWDYSKNELKPDEITYGNNKKIWWRCENGHSWQAAPYTRAKGIGCPYCSNKRTLQGFSDLLTVNPTLCQDWDYEKNGDLRPSDVSANDGKKVWWKCSSGHSWQATVNHRAQGTGCPYCSGKRILSGFNDLQTLHPELIREWDFEKNTEIKPTDVSPRSDKKVWWICERKHEWQASVSNRVGGTGCPYCSGTRILPGYNDIATLRPDLLEIWDFEKNIGIDPNKIGVSSTRKAWWKCKNGHSWQTTVTSKIKSRYTCPYCQKETKQISI